jgi:hypothetical protein
MRHQLPSDKKNDLGLIGQSLAWFKVIFSSRQTVYVLIAAVLLTVVWSGWSLRNLSTEYSIRQFYPKEHPLLKKDREIRQTFQLNEKAPFLFVVTLNDGQNWLEKAQVQRLRELSKTLQEREDVSQALSLTLIEGASQTKKELFVGSVFDRVPVGKWKEAVMGNPLLFPLLITPDFRSTLIVLEAKATQSSELRKFQEQMESLIQKKFPQAQVLTAGVPVIQSHLSDLIHSELGKFLAIAILAFCAIFYFLFSHWTAIACACFCLLATNFFSLGLLAFLKVPMNAVLVTLPIVTSVSVMSLLIHTLHLWSQKAVAQSGSFQDRWRGSVQAIRELMLANFLGSWTTALGFVALAPSHIPIIHQYGWVVALVIGIVAIYGQLLLLIGLPFVQPRMRRWFDRPAKWSVLPLRHPKMIFYSTLVVSLMGAGLLIKLNFSGRLFDDLPKGDTVRASTEWMDQVYGGVVSYELVLSAKQEGFWKDPLSLHRLSALARHLRQESAVGSVVTLTDFFQAGIPAQKSQVAETFFLFSMAEKNPLSQIMTEDAKQVRLMIRLKDLPSQTIAKTRTWIHDSAKVIFPEVSQAEGGMAVTSHNLNQEVARELVIGFWHSLLLIGLFLVLMFRSPRWALVACLPNFIPPAILIGALALTKVPIKPGVALIFSIALGFAFNNTVYLLSRLRSLMRTGKFPLKRAMMMEANPCFFESLVMLVGFSIFIFSSFSMNQIFGVFMMISIVAGFVADLFFLPAMLKLFPGLLKTRSSSEGGSGSVYVLPISRNEDGFVSPSKAAGFALALIAGSLLFSQPLMAADAKAILEKSRSQLDAKDDQAKVDMKIIEKNGETKSRVIDLKTFRKNGFSVIAKIQSPVDIKGMGFLGQVKDGKEVQWIYLPSSGQVRRVVTGQTKGGLLGSEISPEDLNSQAIQSSKIQVLKDDAQDWSIELTPAKGTSAYTRVVSQISKKDFLPKKTEYFAGSRLKKTVEFKNYAKFGNVWRAQEIEVKNHLNGRGTQVRLSQMKVNSGLSVSDFSQSALKD